ncbi:hypothetical protein GCM10010372_84080 [Streptomyces tauricus]|nr:hypothetical protein GCM10010372_84080 [Streptomyces tauricus]
MPAQQSPRAEYVDREAGTGGQTFISELVTSRRMRLPHRQAMDMIWGWPDSGDAASGATGN